ncbi:MULTISPECIES: hypothetical protein [unclassified Kitasatospora]
MRACAGKAGAAALTRRPRSAVRAGFFGDGATNYDQWRSPPDGEGRRRCL